MPAGFRPVEDFPSAISDVAIVAEVLREGNHILCPGELSEVDLVIVDPRPCRAQSSQEGRPGRIADGSRAIGSVENKALFGKAVQNRGFGLRVAIHAPNPVVQVVYGDEENIPWLGLRWKHSQ